MFVPRKKKHFCLTVINCMLYSLERMRNPAYEIEDFESTKRRILGTAFSQ